MPPCAENHTSNRIDSLYSLSGAVQRLASVHLRTSNTVGKQSSWKKKHPSASSVAALAIQIALVVAGIRSAYLLDSFAVDRASLVPFLNSLALDVEVPSNDLAVYYEEATEQTFFVNTSLIRSRITQGDFPVWIATASPYLKTSPPLTLTYLMEHLPFETGTVHMLRAEDPLDMIPFAAFLLEYPVGYVVESLSQESLTDITVTIIELYLSPPEQRIPLIKFSIPEIRESDCPSIINIERFRRRLADYPSLGEIHVNRSLEYFSRLAL